MSSVSHIRLLFGFSTAQPMPFLWQYIITLAENFNNVLASSNFVVSPCVRCISPEIPYGSSTERSGLELISKGVPRYSVGSGISRARLNVPHGSAWCAKATRSSSKSRHISSWPAFVVRSMLAVGTLLVCLLRK